MITKKDLIILSVVLVLGLLMGGAIMWGFLHKKQIEYKPDPIVNVLQKENAVLKDSNEKLKVDISKRDSAYAVKSNQYILTKYKYEKLRKDVAGLNSAGSIDMLNRLFPER
jgi:sensor histidine kinase regulating citrate/malate metabolism